MAPICRIKPKSSERPHDSAIWPPSMRYIEIPVKFTLLPVGGMPMYSPWWVAWALQWATTLSLSAMRSSMVLSKSGKPRRTLAASCLASSTRSGAKSSAAASRLPVWFQSSPCSRCTRALFSSTDMLLLLVSAPRILAGQTLRTDEYDASYRSTAHALSTGELLRIPLLRTRLNKDEKQGLRYGPPHPRRMYCTLFVRSPSNPQDERSAHVRQPNFQGGDRRVRPDRRDRNAWYLFLGRDGRIALCAVRACFGVLCDVPSRVLLVDGVRTGTRPVRAGLCTFRSPHSVS